MMLFTSAMSSPRDAKSVETSILFDLFEKRKSAASRCFCSKPPCKALTQKPSLERYSYTLSTLSR